MYVLCVSQKVMPHVIEPALGVNRLLLALLCEGFQHELQPGGAEAVGGESSAVYSEADGSLRPLLRLPAPVAPTSVAVLPLVKKGGLLEKANAFADQLTARAGIQVEVDVSGSIGTCCRSASSFA